MLKIKLAIGRRVYEDAKLTRNVVYNYSMRRFHLREKVAYS